MKKSAPISIAFPVGIPEPLIVGRGINDVAVVVLTLSPKPDAASRWTDKDLYQLADELGAELVKTDNVGLTYISGGNPQQIRIEPDPEKLALFGVTLQQLVAKVRDANRSFQAGAVRDNDTMRDVAAGQTLSGIPDVGLLLVTTRDNRPVYVRDVASVVIGPSPEEHRVWMDTPGTEGHWQRVPAVSIAFAKRAGANAVVVAEDLLARLKSVEGRLIPPDINVTVTRDYGETANDKANELLFHLGLATISIVVLDRFRHWLARGPGHPCRHPDHHPAHAVRLQADGLHHQPRQPVCAHLRHRYPCRRRHRRGREHRPPLGHEGRPQPHASGHRGGGGSRQSDHRRHLDRGGGVVADAVRLRSDGTLHGADTGQCLGGDAVLVLRRRGHRAVADAALEPRGTSGPRARSAAWRRRSWQALSPLCRPGRAFALECLGFPDHGRRWRPSLPACCS